MQRDLCNPDLTVYSPGGRYVRDLACATGVALLGWFIALVTVLIVALVVTLLGRSMFWYTHFYASICLYGAAATGKMILVHTLAKNLYFGVSKLTLIATMKVQLMSCKGVSSSPCPGFYLAKVFIAMRAKALSWLGFISRRHHSPITDVPLSAQKKQTLSIV